MDEYLWADDPYLMSDEDELQVHVSEITSVATGEIMFIAMGNDDSQIIGTGKTAEEAVSDFETKLFEYDTQEEILLEEHSYEQKLAS